MVYTDPHISDVDKGWGGWGEEGGGEFATSTWIPREDFPLTGWSSYLLAVDSCYTEMKI